MKSTEEFRKERAAEREPLKPRMARIGRPGIGGEFLDVCADDYGRYRLRRFRQTSATREEPRQLNVADLPAGAMVYDLLEAIERIVEHMEATHDFGVDLDDHGLGGDRPSLRERFQALADKGDGR